MARGARPRRRSSGEAEQYIVIVTGWEFAWSLSIGDARFDPGPYSEFSLLTISGTVFRPVGFKVDHASITVSGVATSPMRRRAEGRECAA
jgi:hypothetical protein